jgi:hypothetical protein
MLTIFYESGDKVVFSSSWAAPGVGDRPWTPYGRLIRPVRDQLAPLVYCGTYYNVHCVYT